MPVPPIADSLPGLVTASDTASLRAQSRFRLLTAASLVLFVVAALPAVVHDDWLSWISVTAFASLIALTTLIAKSRQTWYDGRAATESGKSLSFKYAVGGEPLGRADAGAAARFHELLAEIAQQLQRLRTDIRGLDAQTTDAALEEVRSLPLADRAEAYRTQRLADQRDWYVRRARDHRTTATRWLVLMYALQVAGLVAALLRALDQTDLDWFAICATAAASVAAWLEAGDYAQTARAYDFASLELGAAMDGVANACADEQTWAQFVADSETAISREHTMWLARRRGAA